MDQNSLPLFTALPAISRDQPEFAAVLEEHVPAGLAGVDADAVCGGWARGMRRGQLRARARRGSFVSIKGRETRKERAHAPLVMMALVAAGTLNSSAAYLSTAVTPGPPRGRSACLGRGRGWRCERRGFDRCLADPNDAVPSDGPGLSSTRDAVRRRGRTYTRNGNLGRRERDLEETFDMITGDGRSCATRAILTSDPLPDRPVGPAATRVFGAIGNN